MNYKKIWEESDKLRLDDIRILENTIKHLKQMSAGEHFRRHGIPLSSPIESGIKHFDPECSEDELPKFKNFLAVIEENQFAGADPWLYESNKDDGKLIINDEHFCIGKLPWVNEDGTVDREWYDRQD